MGNYYENNEKVSKKDWLTSLILCWFLGFLGVHRFYAGKLVTGFLIFDGTLVATCITLLVNKYLGALGFVVVGSFVLYDFLNILIKNFKDVNGREISEDTVVK